MQQPKSGLAFLAVICVILSSSLLPSAYAQPPRGPPNVNVQFNAQFASLACGAGGASQPIGFIETLNQFTLLNLAQYQALAVLKAGYGKIDVPIQDASAVAAYAAHYIMVAEFRQLKGFFDETLKNVTDALQLVPGQESSARVTGQGVAKQLLATRSSEGFRYAATSVTYVPAANASLGEWSYSYPQADYLPDPYPTGLSSASNRPYVLPDPEVYRKEAIKTKVPPKVSSAVYKTQYDLVLNLGRDASTARTPDQTNAAAFWAGAALGSPCNSIATWINATIMVLPPTYTLQKSVQLFTEMAVAASDAFLLNQHLQYTYRFWRPVDAITRGDAVHPARPNWSPLLPTPSSPEYPSDDATVAGALAYVLQLRLATAKPTFFGDTAVLPFTYGPTVPAAVAPRSFKSWTAAAQEMAYSGVWAGTQFNSSCVDGLAIGKAVGTFVIGHFTARTPTGLLPDTLLLEYTAPRPRVAGAASPPGFGVDVGP